MPLKDRVEERIPESRLIQLTNPGDPDATVVSGTRLQFAVDEALADFEIIGGLTYDDTDANHYPSAVQRVIYRLQLFAGNLGEGMTNMEVMTREAIQALARVTSRDRILPKTNSGLEPTTDADFTGPLRPPFDERVTGGFTLKPPRSRPATHDRD